MSENICNVMTPFADVAELGQGYMGRADGERLWVPLAEPAELEGDVAFVIYLVDGTPAFAGSGRCIQVADQGEGVDPQVRFEALLDTLAFDERSQPVYDYIVAVRAAAEQASVETDDDVYGEDEAPAEGYADDEEAAADYAAVSVDQTVEYGTEAVSMESAEVDVDDGFGADAYGQPEGAAADARQDQTPVGEPDAGAEADVEHAAQSFGEHAAWSGETNEESEGYGEEVSEMPVHTASDAPENTAGEGFTDPGFAEPALLEPPTEATAPGGLPYADEAAMAETGAVGEADDASPAYPEAAFDPGMVEPPYDANVTYDDAADGQPSYAEGAYDPGAAEQAPMGDYAQQAYDQGEYDPQAYSLEEDGADALELPPEITGRTTPSARPAEAAVETVMTPSIMPIATGILSRPAIALHFQPVRAKGPARSAATGLFEYAQGELPVPAQLPMPAGY